MIHVYCGDGKGKTTAAAGLAARFAGAGGTVVAARFLKTEDSGEAAALRSIPGITVIPCRKSFGFTWTMTPEEKVEAAEYARGLLREAERLALEAAVGAQAAHSPEEKLPSPPVLLVLDELAAAMGAGFLGTSEVLGVLDRLEDLAEIVITGRNPAKELLDRADYITEMRKIRHPYERGIPARRGIEY